MYAILAHTDLRKKYLSQKAKHFFLKHPQTSAAYKLNLAFEAFFDNTIYADAKKYFPKIDLLRSQLLNNKTVIKRNDFGAGITKQAHKPQKQTTIAALCKGSSMPQSLGKLLSYIIENVKPDNCLELGTCLGISGSYIGFALQKDGGKLVTLEGDRTSAEIASRNFEKLGLHNIKVQIGRFADTLPAVLHQLKTIDFAFIDGHHNGPATIQYYEQLKPYLAEQAILIFDDIDWSADMQNAWQQLTGFKELYICIDLGRTGICIFSKLDLDKDILFLPI
jgi:predicted O-methyltransferase YrrM